MSDAKIIQIQAGTDQMGNPILYCLDEEGTIWVCTGSHADGFQFHYIPDVRKGSIIAYFEEQKRKAETAKAAAEEAAKAAPGK